MKKIIAIILALVMVFALCACGGDGGMMNGGDDSGSASSGNGKTYQWRLASAWGEGSRQFEFDQRFCDKVEEMSNGRLVI